MGGTVAGTYLIIRSGQVVFVPKIYSTKRAQGDGRSQKDDSREWDPQIGKKAQIKGELIHGSLFQKVKKPKKNKGDRCR
jgi:hypothetical protein